MWWRGWSGANPSVVSPRGRGCSGGTHGHTALSGGRGSHACGGRSSCGLGGDERSSAGVVGRGRGGKVHPGPESASFVGLHHTKAGEGEERGGRGGGGGGGGAGNERSWPINDPIKWLKQKDREINGGHRKQRVCRRRKVKGEEQWQDAKISQPGKFPGRKLLPCPQPHL